MLCIIIDVINNIKNTNIYIKLCGIIMVRFVCNRVFICLEIWDSDKEENSIKW